MKTAFSDLPKGKAFIVVPPMFVAKMTGVVMAKQDNSGDVKLVYTDHTTETGLLAYSIPNEDNFFKIVGDTQAAARATGEGVPRG